MPIYEHACEACNYEWEDIFRNYEDFPEECPKCKAKGKIKRLMSICAGRVELTGRELVQSLKKDGKKIAEKAKKDDNVLADIIGHDTLHKTRLNKSK